MMRRRCRRTHWTLWSETYFYTISQNIPREEPDYYYSDFTVRDILPECLEFVSAKVEDDAGKDVTFRFLVSHDDQNVTFQVKSPASAIFYGVTYHFKGSCPGSSADGL